MNCQQDELYAAERLVEPGTEFTSLAEAQRFVDELRELDYWRRSFSGVLRIEVQFGSGRSRGGVVEPGVGVINLTAGQRNPHIAVHEVAHVLSEARYGSRSHDPWYCRTYLELASVALTRDQYLTLYAGMVREGVDFNAEGANPAGWEM